MELRTKIDLFGKIKVGKRDYKVFQAPNICELFTDEDLTDIASEVIRGYKADDESRTAWMRRTESAMKLAMQVAEDKTFPWPGASNVKFPLVTIATLQFHSRAYPTLIDGPDVVKCKNSAYAKDDGGVTQARAYRIGCHMSYQRLETDQPWEEQHDRMLINVPIVGCAFKKSYWDNKITCGRSELVLARDLVLNYYAKSVEDCTRKTHVMQMSRNDIYARCKRGAFRDVTGEAWFQQPAPVIVTPNTAQRDGRVGLMPPQNPDPSTNWTVLEQHVSMDFDQDGYEEPWVITVIQGSDGNGYCVRIVARFDQEVAVEKNTDKDIVCITATEYFTKYPFIPSPDGGIYDVGFGTLLGPLNESTNTIINQLVDVGTMQATAGGFLGRGVKIRGGAYTFAPLEWKRVDSTGDDLSKNIVPLPVREPSAVLFQLLSLLIGYVNRIAGTTDQMVGENPGQNTPAYNQESMIEQGMKVYNAIFKRIWRASKEEFKKLYKLNSVHLPESGVFADGMEYRQSDYTGDPNEVVPYADPNMGTDADRTKQAITLKQLSANNPGYDQDAVEVRVLRALRVDNIAEVYHGVKNLPPPPPDVKVQVEQLKVQLAMQKLDYQKAKDLADTMESHELTKAKITQLEAAASQLQAQAALQMEQAGGVQQGHAIAQFDAILGIMKEHEKAQSERIKIGLKSLHDAHSRDMAEQEAADRQTELDQNQQALDQQAQQPAKAAA